MSFHVDFGLWGSIFAVPTAIADRHLKFCSEAQLKVLLLALRDGADEIDTLSVGRRLGLPEEAVLDCLCYWQEAGVFTQNAAAEPHTEAAPSPTPTPVPAAETIIQRETTPQGQRITTIRERSHLTPGEINDLLQRDERFPALIAELEGRFGKVLSPTERESVAYLYRYLELSADYILMAAARCKQQGKTNFRYLEKMISGWVDEGVDTFEKAEVYLKKLAERQNAEEEIRHLFGLPDRALSTKEKGCIARWSEVYHTPRELLQLAFDRTVDQTGKVSFAYIDKILASWNQKGIHTAEEADRERGAAKTAAAKAAAGEHSFDIEEAFRIMDQNSNH